MCGDEFETLRLTYPIRAWQNEVSMAGRRINECRIVGVTFGLANSTMGRLKIHPYGS